MIIFLPIRKLLLSMLENNQEIELTKKQEMFCRYYVSNGHNGVEAAISAGYSKNSAKQIAAENLSKPYLQQFIKSLEQPVIEKLALDENWVLTKLKVFSEAVITDYFDITPNGIKLKDFSTISKEKLSAIESIKETKYGIELKLVDKRPCIVDIGKHLGMFKEQVEHSGDINIVIKGLEKI